MKIQNVASWMVVLGLIIFVLIAAKNLLIPFVVAIAVVYLINSLAELLQKIKFRGRYLKGAWATTTSSLVIVLLIIGAIEIIVGSIEGMAEELGSHQDSFSNLVASIKTFLGLEELPGFTQMLEKLDLKPIFLGAAGTLSSIAGNMFLIIIYVIFILLEQRNFATKLKYVFPDPEHHDQIMDAFGRINASINTYVSIKTGISIITAGLSYFIMLAIGLDLPEFWAFMIFLLNFIPNFGSIIAMSLPTLFAIIQFEGLTEALIILSTVGAVEIFAGNFLEPRLMGNNLNISTLVVLLSLSFWSIIWGVIGMVLAVPIMVILTIILAEFPQTRPIAILLSEKGVLQSTAPTKED